MPQSRHRYRTGRPTLFPRCSRRKGCRVGSERHHVVERQIDDIGRHQRARWTGSRAVLKIIELPHEVARRPSCEAGDGSHSVQFGPMTDRAWRALSVAAGGGELPALVDTAGWYVRDEA